MLEYSAILCGDGFPIQSRPVGVAASDIAIIFEHTNEIRTPLFLTIGYHKESQTGWAVLRDNVLKYDPITGTQSVDF